MKPFFLIITSIAIFSLTSFGQSYQSDFTSYSDLNQSRAFILNKYQNFYIAKNEDNVLAFNINVNKTVIFTFNNERICYQLSVLDFEMKSEVHQFEYRKIKEEGWEKIDELTSDRGTKYYAFERSNKYLVYIDAGYIFALELINRKPDLSKIEGTDTSKL